jgi:glutathione reductase (NADPH)
MPDYDLIVIGAGSGGVRAARVAAELGAKVAVVEQAALGGTCVNAGCIPKKLLFYGAERARGLREAAGFGLSVHDAAFDWATLAAGKDREVARLNVAYGRTLERAGAQIVPGAARLLDAHRVDVDGQELSARYLLIATGSTPVVPAVQGAQLGMTSNDVLAMQRLPERVVIVGAGVIGLELAGILHGLGSAVQIVHRGPRVLSGFDDDVRMHLGDELRKQGIALALETTVQRLEHEGGGLRVTRSDGVSTHGDVVVFATGRRPNTGGLGLGEVGVARDEQGAIRVDAYGRSNLESIFAIGDCIGGIDLTPRAIAHGQAVARTLFAGGKPQLIERALLPRAVFSHPEVASVGLAEGEAREQGHDLRTYRASWKPLVHALSGLEDRSFVKLVVDADSDRVLGCHMVGADAAEVIQGFAVAMQCGATKAQLDETLPIHPTAAEELVTLR